MKMIISFIDDDNSLMKKNAKSNVNMYDLIIDELFHIISFFPNVLMLILILKFVRTLMYSNISSNMYLKMMIE